MPATLSIIVHVTPPQRRARAIAAWASSSGVGVAIGPVGGGLLLQHFWWGSVFLVNVPFVVLCLVGVVFLVPPLRYPERPRLDPAGLLLSLAGLGGVIYGVITGSRDGHWLRPGTALPLAGGVLLLTAFVMVQRASATPSFDARLFGRREFAAGSLALFFAFFGLAGQLFYAAFYLQSVRGLDPLQAGAAMLPAAAGIIAGNQISPALAARRPARLVVAAGMLAVIGTFAAYLLFDAGTPLPWFGLMLLVQGVGMGLVSTPVTMVMMAVLPPERTGAGSALNSAMRQVGGTLGVAVIGSVLTAAYRRATGPRSDGLPPLGGTADQAFLHAMSVAAVWTCALTLIGVVIVLGWMRPPAGR